MISTQSLILEVAARAIFDHDFDGRILPFDQTAAGLYAVLYAARKRAGRPTPWEAT